MMFQTSNTVDSTWRDNPAYVPFAYIREGTSSPSPTFTNDAINPWGFTRWLVSSTFKRATMYVDESADWKDPFKVYLARDGPVIDGGITGPPVKENLIYTVLADTDPQYTRKLRYEGPDIEMFSGHSWGYIFELDNPVPTLPTTEQLQIAMTSVIYFGGAGV